MDRSVFTNGIVPGGLTSRNQVLLLICYLLKSIDAPLFKKHLVQIIQANGLANYFEVTDAIGELLKRGHIVPGDSEDLLMVTESGRRIADTLETDLPPAIRDRAVRAAVKLMSRIKVEKENQVEISKEPGGYKVTCHISDGKRELMQLSLLVADRIQAETVKEDFLTNPERIYLGVLALQTGDVDMFRQIAGI